MLAAKSKPMIQLSRNATPSCLCLPGFGDSLGGQVIIVVSLLFASCGLEKGATQDSHNSKVSPTKGTQNQERISLQRGLKYLLNQQSESGAWKSEYYGNLKQGAATTSLTLFAISSCSPDLVKKHRQAIQAGFDFLKPGIDKHGFVANVSGPDYSNYATALTLLAHTELEKKLGTPFISKAQRQKLIDFLVAAQVDETHGLQPTDDDYGGWDLSGWMQGVRSSPGTNVSVSSFVLMALNEVDTNAASVARSKAKKWLARIQNPDHGFHFHPKKDHHGNKAEWADKQQTHPRSYGTATVDGLRILRCLEMDPKQVQQSSRWLETQHESTTLQSVPGFEGDASNQDSWAQGLAFYYYMSLALESQTLSQRLQARIRKEIPAILIKQQQQNGSWENRSARMREDDPLIATSFAVIALARLSDSQPDKTCVPKQEE